MTRDGYAAYSKIDAVNWTTLKELRRSPLHYRHRLTTPREDNARLALGRAAHTAVFEPDRFLLDYALFEGERRAGKAWEAFAEQHANRTILKRAEYEQCLAIRNAVREHRVAATYLERGAGEKAIRWTDRATGIECKARLDWHSRSRPAIVDLKSTGDISKFADISARMLYHCQGAFYQGGLEAVEGERFPVVFIAVEKDAPHDVGVFVLDEDALYAGSEEVRYLLERVTTCRQTGRWPGRYDEEQSLRLPTWMFGDEEGDSTGLDLVVNGQEVR
jgi:exodeoxyribonuclease VIII